MISYAAKITQPCMGFANEMAPDVSEGIFGAQHESVFLGQLITDLHADIKKFKMADLIWRSRKSD